MIRIAIVDDYQNVSLEMADWSPLAGRAVITVFNDHWACPTSLTAAKRPNSSRSYARGRPIRDGG